MSQFRFIFLVAAICLLAPSQAQQQRRTAGPQRLIRPRYFERQQLASASTAGNVDTAVVTPYPSADEIKPEIPFEEAAAEPTPDAVYGPPDAVSSNNVPDEIYGPPDVTGNDAPVADVATEQQARLVAPRRMIKAGAGRQSAAQRRLVARPAKLRAVNRF